FKILAISTLCCTSILSNMNVYNFTRICSNPIDPSTGNSTRMEAPFSSTQRSVLQSATAVGALLSSLPYLFAFHHYSPRLVFLSAGVISIISTSLAPLSYFFGFCPFLLSRIFQGVAISTTFQMIGLLTHDWATNTEHGIFLAFLTGSTQLSSIFTMLISGLICSSSLGWPFVFYVHALVCAIVFLLFFFIYRDHPEDHMLVTESELSLIMHDKEEKLHKRDTVPYKKLFTDLPLLVSWLSAFADLLCIQLINQYEPVYFNDYLHYNIFKSGFLSAVPILAQFSAKLLSGISSDYIKFVSPTTNVKIYNSLSLIVSGCFMIGLAFIPPSQPLLCVAAITVTVCFIGFNTAGFNKSTTLRSRQHAHFAMTQIMNIWAVTILIEPFIVQPILTDHSSESQWMAVFILHGLLVISAGMIFVFTADATPAEWTKRKSEMNLNRISTNSFASKT
ncbi:hypothetical protein PMAYCL1PPCAC_08147, partial [Pristionchus mayeri]